MTDDNETKNPRDVLRAAISQNAAAFLSMTPEQQEQGRLRLRLIRDFLAMRVEALSAVSIESKDAAHHCLVLMLEINIIETVLSELDDLTNAARAPVSTRVQ